MKNESLTISIVINTLNRASSLAQALTSLQWQKYDGEFEVIVVNGPSTDNTEEILNNWRSRIRTAQCPVPNLSVSRNIGICMARGDIVAFIDDDGIPEPEWLTQIAEGYDSKDVGGVGGFVFDHTGYAFQYKYCLVDRLGGSDISRTEPTEQFSFPGSYQFPHFLGTNCTFRRSALLEINGFDEEYEYFLDETDVCLKLVDAGYILRQQHNAYVHHRYAPSHLRNNNRVVKHYYPILKNKLYFMLKHARPYHSLERIFVEQNMFITQQRQNVQSATSAGFLDKSDEEKFEKAVEHAFEIGLKRGLEGAKAEITPEKIKIHTENFLRFPTLSASTHLHIVIISRDNRSNLAKTLAAQGHIVQLVTESQDINRVDFEDGVWVHKILLQNLAMPTEALRWSATALKEVERIASHRTIDVVEAPLRNCEGIAFLRDGRWPLLTTLQSNPQLPADNIGAEQELMQKSSAICSEQLSLLSRISLYSSVKERWKNNRNLKISYVCGLCVKHDAVSRSIKDEINALQTYGIQNIRLYTYDCDYADFPYSIVTCPEQVLTDPHFNSSDIIVYHFAIYSPLFDLINTPSKAKKIAVFHNITPKEFLPVENHEVIEKSFAQLTNIASADRIVCDSQTNLSVLRSMNIETSAEILPLAVHTPPKFPSRKPSFNDEKIRLLFIGRFVKAKGPEDLLAAIEIFLNNDHSQPSLQLDLVGNLRFSDQKVIESIYQTMEKWSKKFSRQISVTLHGSATDEVKFQLLQEADLFILPTYHEGFCVPILEAIGSGCKIITYENSNTPTICGGLAQLVPTGNIAELAAQLKNAIEKIRSQDWRGTGKSGYNDYVQKAQTHLKIYQPDVVRQRFINFLSLAG